MLKELSVHNFALIDSLNINFEKGLNVLSGETGAGKSIVLDAISLVCGKRANSKWIRKGCESASVSAYFVLSEELKKAIEDLDLIYLDGNELYLDREIASNGKNNCKINFKKVPLNIYQLIGVLLFDIHGQNQEQSILLPGKQLELLNHFLDEDGQVALVEVKRLYLEYEKIAKEIKDLLTEEIDKKEMLDYYSFCLKEIREGELVLGEEEKIKEERNKIANGEKLSKSGRNVQTLLDSSLESYNEALVFLENMSNLDPTLQDLYTQTKEGRYDFENIREIFNKYFSTLDFDERRLDVLESRLSVINRLKKKYGGSVELVLEKQERMEEAINKVENKELVLQQLKKKKEACLLEYQSKADTLSLKRKDASEIVTKLIKERLKDLGIYEESFTIELQKLEEPSLYGQERVEFLFSPNKGEGVGPLRAIASGGEISRIMLAFKNVFAKVDNIPSMVFDEIDTGVGGDALIKVAQSLNVIAQDRQVICVTHAPIIAAFADYHLYIYKEEIHNRTKTMVKSLIEEEKRIEEISRMIGGREKLQFTEIQSKEMLSFALTHKNV